MRSNARSRRASRASWSHGLACEAVKLEVPMRVDIKYGRSWGDAKHTWEELHGIAPATTEVAPIQPQDGDFEDSEALADSRFPHHGAPWRVGI